MSRHTVSFQGQRVLDSEHVTIEALDRDEVRIRVNLTEDLAHLAHDDVTIEFFKGGRAFRKELPAPGVAKWEARLPVENGIDARNCTALLFTSKDVGGGTHLVTGRSAARRTEWAAGDSNSLLPVRPDEELGSMLWEMQFEGGPVLAVRDTPSYPYTRLISDEIFLGAVLPEAVRKVVHWLAGDRDDDTSEQAAAWLKFLVALQPGFDLSSTLPEQVDELARMVTMTFAKHIKVAESLESREHRDSNV